MKKNSIIAKEIKFLFTKPFNEYWKFKRVSKKELLKQYPNQHKNNQE